MGSTISRRRGSCRAIDNLAFDVSATIPPASVLGTTLKGVFNFSPATTWLQAIAWVAYIVPVSILFIRLVWGSAPPPARITPGDRGPGDRGEPAEPVSTPAA